MSSLYVISVSADFLYLLYSATSTAFQNVDILSKRDICTCLYPVLIVVTFSHYIRVI